MLGHDGRFTSGKAANQVRRRLAQVDDGGVVVGGVDALKVGEGAGASGVEALDQVQGEGHVSRGEGLAVMPLDPFAQGETVT